MVELDALSPVIMAQFNGVRICGARDGLPFTEITRVEKNGKCPTGTTPCNKETRSEYTICYPPTEHLQKCPITQINIVGEAEAKSLVAQGGYQSVSIGYDQVLVYSK